jgi:urocanate hydratase
MNAARMCLRKRGVPPGKDDFRGMLFVTAGLGGMSGAQPKAAKVAGIVSITAEINPAASRKRHAQGWVDEVHTDLDTIIDRAEEARKTGNTLSLAYEGNIIDLWEALVRRGIKVDIGSDQTSLHNPFAGGYYPAGFSLEESNTMMADEPERFHEEVYKSLMRHTAAVNSLSDSGMYFFDYGNAFLLEASRSGADVVKHSGGAEMEFRYPSYVQDILGPLCFDYGFGPFRWVCCSGDPADLDTTDRLAAEVLRELLVDAPDDIRGQIQDNLTWILHAKENQLVVGSQARILYADAQGRMKIAARFNQAIASGEIKGTIVLGRDHHDVSGTDSPYRETSNIYDGSRYTADMAVQNFAGDAFRGATWISLHNGGGVGWGEVINGGFGMVIDGSSDSDRRIKSMLHWDVNNGIARRAWARNKEAIIAIERAMEQEPKLKITIPNLVDDRLLDEI